MYRVKNTTDFVYYFPRETWSEAVQTMIMEDGKVEEGFKIGNGKIYFSPVKNWTYEEG